jgi:hypothetical protein
MLNSCEGRCCQAVPVFSLDTSEVGSISAIFFAHIKFPKFLSVKEAVTSAVSIENDIHRP